MRTLVSTALLIAAFAAPVVAQAQTPPTAPPSPRPPAVAVPAPGVLPPVFVPQQTPPPPVPAPGRGGRGQMTPPPSGRGQAVNPNVPVTRVPWQLPSQNIRVELTITDSSAKSGKKSVSMLLADGYNGRIRSAGPAR